MNSCLICKKEFSRINEADLICKECISKDTGTSDEAILEGIIHRVLSKYNGKVPNDPLKRAVLLDARKVLNQFDIGSIIKEKVIKGLSAQLDLMKINFRSKLREIQRDMKRKKKDS